MIHTDIHYTKGPTRKDDEQNSLHQLTLWPLVTGKFTNHWITEYTAGKDLSQFTLFQLWSVSTGVRSSRSAVCWSVKSMDDRIPGDSLSPFFKYFLLQCAIKNTASFYLHFVTMQQRHDTLSLALFKSFLNILILLITRGQMTDCLHRPLQCPNTGSFHI